MLRWLATEYGLSYTTLEDINPDRQLLSLFPARILLKEELLPLQRVNGHVEVATSRLFATQGLDALKTLTGLNLKPVLASTEAIQREIKKRLGVGADTIGTLDEEKGLQVVDENAENTNLDDGAEDEASIIRFVNQVLKDAIELRASDVHLEPFEDEFRIRYRIDGELQEVPVPKRSSNVSSRHDCFPRENLEPSQHCGKTSATGRSHQGAHCRRRRGHTRFHHSDVARRSGRDAFVAAELQRCAAWGRLAWASASMNISSMCSACRTGSSW